MPVSSSTPRDRKQLQLSSSDHNGWKLVSSTKARRPLEGPELLVNYSEYYNEGDFQLTLAFPFTTSIDAAALEKRFPAAVWLTRNLLPELGIDTVSFDPVSGKKDPCKPDLDHATFKAVTSLEQGLGWLDETALVVHNARSFEEVCERISNQRIEPAGKHLRAHLVLSPKEGPSALVMNASHVLSGHRVLFQSQTILQCLFHPGFDQATSLGKVELVASVFQPENLERLLLQLPQSLAHAYKDRFQPALEELNIGTQKLAERIENETKPTIGIPSVANVAMNEQGHAAQPMVTLRRSFDRQEQERFRITCKRNNVTISSFVYAALVKAIDHVTAASDASSNRTLAKGAHLTFPAHASRWLPQETSNKARSAVTMAIAPASVYLDSEELRPTDGCADSASAVDAQVQDVFRLARIISTKQNEFLKSEHVLAFSETFWRAGAKGIEAQALEQQHMLPFSDSSFSTPTLTSQGIFDISKTYPLGRKDVDHSTKSASKLSHWLELVDVIQYGRATSPSVCFSLYSFDGKLNLMVHFDTRRFSRSMVASILDQVCILVLPCCHNSTL